MSVHEIYSHSALAQAAYADLDAGLANDVALRGGADMSRAQALEFAGQWEVVDRYDGELVEGLEVFGFDLSYLTSTGLSVTLFEEVGGGRQVVSIRGTEPTDFDDVETDIVDVGFFGNSLFQIQYHALSFRVRDWIDSGYLRPGFDVSGHSLGGFLATSLAVDYQDQIAHTYIYNAPGVGGVTGGVVQAIYDALYPENGVSVTGDSLPITSIVAEGDVVSAVGTQVVSPIVIETEATGASSAHSITEVTDSLAIYDVFTHLNPSTPIDSISALAHKSDIHSNPASCISLKLVFLSSKTSPFHLENALKSINSTSS